MQKWTSMTDTFNHAAFMEMVEREKMETLEVLENENSKFVYATIGNGTDFWTVELRRESTTPELLTFSMGERWDNFEEASAKTWAWREGQNEIEKRVSLPF